MAFKISDETLKKTTNCIFSFQCLNEETKNICTIERCFGADLCFLETVKPDICPYKNTFGFSYYYCCCPTRVELYKLYRI